MHDKGMIGGSALKTIDTGHGLRVGGIRAEPIDRFGGKGHQSTLDQDLRSLRNSLGRCRSNGVVQRDRHAIPSKVAARAHAACAAAAVSATNVT